jgi:hypothetical protein
MLILFSATDLVKLFIILYSIIYNPVPNQYTIIDIETELEETLRAMSSLVD